MYTYIHSQYTRDHTPPEKNDFEGGLCPKSGMRQSRKLAEEAFMAFRQAMMNAGVDQEVF